MNETAHVIELEFPFPLPGKDVVLEKSFCLPFLAKKKQVFEIVFPDGEYPDDFMVIVSETYFVLGKGVNVAKVFPSFNSAARSQGEEYVKALLLDGWALKHLA